MKIFEFLGLKERQTPSEYEDPAHLRAMKRVNGDVRPMIALDALRNYAKQDAHDQAVNDGKVVELYKNTTLTLDHVMPYRPSPRNVRLVIEQIVETKAVDSKPVELFDQDQEVS